MVIVRESGWPAMSKPQFTVVTPVLNGARFFSDTIQSVVSQTEKNWEYFVVDGGSTDGSLEIAQQAASADSRIRVLTGGDRGMYDAIFRGIASGKGEVCYWINSDDKVMPWAFSDVLSYMASTGAEWVTGMPAFWDAAGALRRAEAPMWYSRTLLRRGFFHGRALGWVQQESTFFARSLLARVPQSRVETIRSQSLAGDFLLWVELAKQAHLHTLPTVLAGFRIHENNASANIDKYLAEVSAAGFWVPPVLVSNALRYAYSPLSILVQRYLTEARYDRLWKP
jgi:glycosyltransferase involved in cell wall biosynthesis